MSQFEDLQACYLKLRKHASQEGPHANGRTPNGHGPDIPNTGAPAKQCHRLPCACQLQEVASQQE